MERYILQPVKSVILEILNRLCRDNSSNGRHYGTNFFKPEKNLEFFRLKICAIDATPGKLEWLAVNNLVYFRGILVGYVIVKVFWAIENNLVYFCSKELGDL